MGGDNPIALYKYKDISGDGIDHVEDMLRNNRLWFSSPTSFNDPFDCRCIFDIGNTREEVVFRKAAFLSTHEGASLNEALVQADKEVPSDPAELNKWQNSQIAGHSRRMANSGILCLTPICDNFIMWTHYAKWHSGICIQFRVRDASATEHIEFLGSALPVEYADRCPLISIVRDSSPDIVRKAFLTKATPFRYEHEFRIVRYGGDPGHKPIPNGIVGAVILGCNIEAAVRDRLLKACAEYDGKIEIVQAELDPSTYGLRLGLVETV